jgi:hypothetical protein
MTKLLVCQNQKISQLPIIKTEQVGDIVLASYPYMRGESLLTLLMEEKITEFNNLRKQNLGTKLNFQRADLHNKNLSRVNLSEVNVREGIMYIKQELQINSWRYLKGLSGLSIQLIHLNNIT